LRPRVASAARAASFKWGLLPLAEFIGAANFINGREPVFTPLSEQPSLRGHIGSMTLRVRPDDRSDACSVRHVLRLLSNVRELSIVLRQVESRAASRRARPSFTTDRARRLTPEVQRDAI